MLDIVDTICVIAAFFGETRRNEVLSVRYYRGNLRYRCAFSVELDVRKMLKIGLMEFLALARYELTTKLC